MTLPPMTKDALNIHVAVVEGQPPRRVRRHGLEEGTAHRIVDVADAGFHLG